MRAGTVWVLIRLAVFALVASSFVGNVPAKSNLDWSAALPLGILPGIGLYWWLSLIRYRPGTEFSSPYALDQPFFPMTKYPLRFWFVASVSLLISGAVAIPIDLIEKNNTGPFHAVLFAFGAFIALALRLWMRRNSLPQT